MRYVLVVIISIALPIFNLAGQPAEFPCTECDHLVETNVVDGKRMGVEAGDVICLTSLNVYDRITFKNIVGSPEHPITIRNCGGKAIIYSTKAFGMKFQYSEHFKLVGDGSSAKYGIKITTEKGFYLALESFTTDFEIASIEIAGPEAPEKTKGFAGIGAKTSPYEDCELFTDPSRQAWVMRNVQIHDNYIHDVGGEGLYIGHGFYKGRAEKKCTHNQKLYAHSIKGLRIYENLIENVGYDGIQIKNADEDVLVHDNTIRNYGTKNHSAHNEGLFIGEGSTGEYYANIIDSGTGNGCQIQGIGNIDLHDNLLINAGECGIYASHGHFVVRWPDGYFNIHNNTILRSQDYGLVFYNNDGGKKIISQNLIISKKPYKKAVEVILYDNSFVPSDKEDTQLQSGERGINLGPTMKKMETYFKQTHTQ